MRKRILPLDPTINVQPWSPVGDPVMLGSKFRKKLWVQKFQQPNGNLAEYSIFAEPNGAIVVPITPRGTLILTRQFKQGASLIPAYDGIFWEFPAGTAKEGEQLDEVAARELREETGCSWSSIYCTGRQLPISTRNSPNYFNTYVAYGCEYTDQQRLDPGEGVIEVWEVSVGEFWQMVDKDELVESSSIVAATKACVHGSILSGYPPDSSPG